MTTGAALTKPVRTATARPATFRDLRAAIESAEATLPKRLAQVARFAIENPDALALGTAASVARDAAVQPSTLVRFAQALGYSGFSDLQDVFRDRLRDQAGSYRARLDALRSHSSGPGRTGAMLGGMVAAAKASLTTLQETVSDEKLDEIVRILAAAETIFLIGQRRSYPVTVYMGYAFGKLGIRNVVIGSAAGIDGDVIGFATERDAALAVSFAPYAQPTIDLARAAKAQGVPLVAITDSAFSPLAVEAEAWLRVAEADFEGFRSLSATMALAMVLTIAVAEARQSP